MLLVPSHNATPVFDANVGSLGLLSDKQVDPVLKAYLCLKEFDRKLVLISVPSEREMDHRTLEARNSELLARMYEGLLPPLNAAIAVLDGPTFTTPQSRQ